MVELFNFKHKRDLDPANSLRLYEALLVHSRLMNTLVKKFETFEIQYENKPQP
jgi:hypothetical protein